jgi:hypothetical protein
MMPPLEKQAMSGRNRVLEMTGERVEIQKGQIETLTTGTLRRNRANRKPQEIWRNKETQRGEERERGGRRKRERERGREREKEREREREREREKERKKERKCAMFFRSPSLSLPLSLFRYAHLHHRRDTVYKRRCPYLIVLQ